MSTKTEDEYIEKTTNEFDGKCRTCGYAKPAVNDDLIYCYYVSDILDKCKDKNDQISTAKYLTKTINFKGMVFEGFVDKDENSDKPSLSILMEEYSSCSKYFKK